MLFFLDKNRQQLVWYGRVPWLAARSYGTAKRYDFENRVNDKKSQRTTIFEKRMKSPPTPRILAEEKKIMLAFFGSHTFQNAKFILHVRMFRINFLYGETICAFCNFPKAKSTALATQRHLECPENCGFDANIPSLAVDDLSMPTAYSICTCQSVKISHTTWQSVCPCHGSSMCVCVCVARINILALPYN